MTPTARPRTALNRGRAHAVGAGPGIVLRNGRFSVFAAGTLLSSIGDVTATLGFLYAAYDITGSKSLTAGVALAKVLPYLLFGLVGGAVSDLLPRFGVMIGTDVVRAVTQIATAVLAASSALTYSGLLVAVLLIQLGGCFFNPCARAVVVDLVDEEQLIGANAVVSVCGNVSAIVAPVLTVVLTSTSGLYALFAVDAATYVLSAMMLAAVARGSRNVSKDAADVHEGVGKALGRIPTAIADFVRFVRGDGLLRVLFISPLLVELAGAWVLQVGLLFKLAPRADSDRSFFSVAMAVYAAIGVVVSLLLPFITKRLSLAHYVAGVAVWAVGIIGLAVAAYPATVTVAVVAVGVGFSLASHARIYLLQTSLPRVLIGQGFSTAATLLYAANSVGLAGIGAAAERTPIDALILGSGIAMLCVAGVVALLLRTYGRRRALGGIGVVR
jgi:MFS transporter, DHA3 family, macrolide efflux protein